MLYMPRTLSWLNIRARYLLDSELLLCVALCTLAKGKHNLRNGKRAACNHGVMDARGRLLSTKEA